MSAPKYVVVMVADQTFGFRAENGGLTTKHPEAKLFETYEEAEKNANLEYDWIDTVEDEAEFRSREDTW